MSTSPWRGAYPSNLGSLPAPSSWPPYTWLGATPAANVRSRERVGQVCAAGGEPLTLRLRLIDELRRVVGFDWYAFVLTDPQTMVGCAPLSRSGGVAAHPRPGRARADAADKRCCVLIPPRLDAAPIPAGAYNVAAQLLAAEAGVDTSPAWARVHVAEGLWLTLRAAPIGDAETGVGSGIAVSIEESSPAERVDLFARCFALTTREQELLGHLVKGNDTKQIARAMFLSEHPSRITSSRSSRRRPPTPARRCCRGCLACDASTRPFLA